MSGGTAFDKQDLYLFMESHKNMVELHTLVLSQLQQVLESNKQLNDKSNQVIVTIEEMTGKMGEFIGTVGKLQIDLAHYQSDNTRAHETLKNNIYIGWVGMVSIIILLIATFL